MLANDLYNWRSLYYGADNKIPAFVQSKSIDITQFTKYSVGRAYGIGERTSNLLIDRGLLYFIDSNNSLVIFNLEDNKLRKKVVLSKQLNRKNHTTGLVIQDEYLYVTFNNGMILSYSLLTDKVLWQQKIALPINSAPIVYANKLFFIAYNMVYAVDVDSGKVLWDYIGSNAGVSAKIFYAPSYNLEHLLIGLPSSDILVLRADQGEVFWKTNLYGRLTAFSNVNPGVGDIKSPILIHQGKLFVASNTKFFLYNISKKEQIWSDTKNGAYNPPIIVDDQLFIINTYGMLLKLNFNNGKLIWKQFLTPKQKTNLRILWYGPIMINNSLLIANSLGEVFLYSSINGVKEQYHNLFTFKKEYIMSYPVVTDKYIVFLSSYGNIYVYKAYQE